MLIVGKGAGKEYLFVSFDFEQFEPRWGGGGISNIVPTFFGDILEKSQSSRNFNYVIMFLRNFPESPGNSGQKSSDCRKKFVFLPKQVLFDRELTPPSPSSSPSSPINKVVAPFRSLNKRTKASRASSQTIHFLIRPRVNCNL